MLLLPPSHKPLQLRTKGGGGGGGGSSNLQRFEAHDPPTLKGGGDPMVAGHCFQLVGKVTGAVSRHHCTGELGSCYHYTD